MVVRKTLTLITYEENPREQGEIEVRISTSGDHNADAHAERLWHDFIEATLLRGQNRNLTVTEW